MAMPDIHSCSQLTNENIKLRKKVKRLKNTVGDLKSELDKINQREQVKELMKEYVTTRSTYVQTDATRSMYPMTPKKQRTKADEKEIDKVLAMHSDAMKRYEKELRVNMENTDIIKNLSIKITELEVKLQEAQSKLKHSEGDKENSCGKRKCRSSSRGSRSASPDGSEISKLRKEKLKLVKENEKLRKELGGLDKGFFDEIEDLKYGLQQSAKLNQKYEKTLKKMCTQFGVPYPHS